MYQGTTLVVPDNGTESLGFKPLLNRLEILVSKRVKSSDVNVRMYQTTTSVAPKDDPRFNAMKRKTNAKITRNDAKNNAKITPE
jgi:hypothetical protein